MKQIIVMVLSKLDQLEKISTPNLALVVVLVALLLVWRVLGHS
jgi:hypothetical protein